MLFPRIFAVAALAVLAQAATAQTTPTTHLPTHRVTRMLGTTSQAAPRTVPNNTPAARAADPLRGTNNNGSGNNGYAAPGEPINVQENVKNTPSYDGPAPKGAARTKTTLGTRK